MLIFDNFIDTYQQLKEYSLSASFCNIISPIDNVTYPDICNIIPDDVKNEILNNITKALNKAPENVMMFMRRSPAGRNAPQIAHTDNSMGRYSLMLYFFEKEGAGTGFIRHKSTGICYAPESEDFLSIVKNDQNNLDKWALVDLAAAKENRAILFDSGMFHCSLPIGGFGEGNQARTVLTVFFN